MFLQQKLVGARRAIRQLALAHIPDFLVQPHVIQFPPRIAAPVERDVGGDAEQPGGELRVGLIPVAEAVHADEDVLRQLLRDRAIAHQPVQVIHYRAAMPFQQKIEARRVAFGDLEHQRGIAIEGKLRHHAQFNACTADDAVTCWHVTISKVA